MAVVIHTMRRFKSTLTGPVGKLHATATLYGIHGRWEPPRGATWGQVATHVLVDLGDRVGFDTEDEALGFAEAARLEGSTDVPGSGPLDDSD